MQLFDGGCRQEVVDWGALGRGDVRRPRDVEREAKRRRELTELGEVLVEGGLVRCLHLVAAGGVTVQRVAEGVGRDVGLEGLGATRQGDGASRAIDGRLDGGGLCDVGGVLFCTVAELLRGGCG